jgi:hypothetical protein
LGWGGKEVSTKNKVLMEWKIYQFSNNSTWWGRKTKIFDATRFKRNITSCAKKLI